MKLPFKIKQVKPGIFLFEFTRQYDMGMHFLRCQEFYECPNPKFRGKSFTILDYMEWWAHTQSKHISFDYSEVWAGFNFPSYVIESCINPFVGNDWNKYDTNMYDSFHHIRDNIVKTTDDFYIIGAMKGNSKIINHEIAHGCYYLNKEYKKEMMKAINNLTPSFRDKFNKKLKEVGYTPKVFNDEIQAYLSTGVPDYFKLNIKTQAKPFIEIFDKYNK